MPMDLDAPTLPAEAEFALAELEVRDGRIVVSGQWFGVRGMRFVRPTLIVGGRSILATMAHKPWAPDADPWMAEFPWKGGPVDAADVSLAVTPRLNVPLAGGKHTEVVERYDATRAEPAAPAAPPSGPETESAAEPPADATAGPGPALVAARAERDRLAGEADQARRDGAAAERERDRVLERLAEAERDRDAALRTRRRWEDSSDEATRDRDDARTRSEHEREARQTAERERARVQSELNRSERELEEAERSVRRLQSSLERSETLAAEAAAARKEAEEERDRIRAQRDETLLAFDTLKRRERAPRAADPVPAPEPVGEPESESESDQAADPQATVAFDVLAEPESETAQDPDPDTEVPLGVRRVPAARGAAADLLSTPVRRGREVSGFDMWAMRILGSVAGVCFILLLVMVLRLFL